MWRGTGSSAMIRRLECSHRPHVRTVTGSSGTRQPDRLEITWALITSISYGQCVRACLHAYVCACVCACVRAWGGGGDGG